MSALAHPADALILPDASAETAAKASTANEGRAEPPVGYRWVSRRWRVLPDGTRDYAAFHGKTAFTSLLPMSSKVKAAKQ